MLCKKHKMVGDKILFPSQETISAQRMTLRELNTGTFPLILEKLCMNPSNCRSNVTCSRSDKTEQVLKIQWRRGVNSLIRVHK